MALLPKEILLRAGAPIRLSERELDVLKLIAHCKTDNELAATLCLRVSTIRNPNQVVTLAGGLGTVTINEQTSSISANHKTGSLTVNALHFRLLNILTASPLVDFIVSQSYAAITCN